MAIAIPPSDMMFDVMPKTFIRMKEIRIGQRQRQRDDQDRAEVQQEEDVRQRDEQDLLEERALGAFRRPGRSAPSGRRTGTIVTPAGRPFDSSAIFSLTRSMTSGAFSP